MIKLSEEQKEIIEKNFEKAKNIALERGFTECKYYVNYSLPSFYLTNDEVYGLTFRSIVFNNGKESDTNIEIREKLRLDGKAMAICDSISLSNIDEKIILNKIIGAMDHFEKNEKTKI